MMTGAVDQHLAGPLPDRGLVRTGQEFDRVPVDWTADGMSCPLLREHLIIRLQASPGAVIKPAESKGECPR